MSASARHAVLRRQAQALIDAAREAVDPRRLTCTHLKRDASHVTLAGLRWRVGSGRLLVVAAGKAAVAMAQAAHDVLGDAVDEWLLVVPRSPRIAALAELRRAWAGRPLSVHEAGHPIPDGQGQRAARQVLARARVLGRDDLLLVLLSGGASALLPAPVPGVRLRDKAMCTRLLMHAGASIAELNALRKHLSQIKGGGLARAAAPARVVTLALSDVVGNDPTVIGSGPTSPDPSTFGDVLRTLLRRGLWQRVPRAVRAYLRAGARGLHVETLGRGELALRRNRVRVFGGPRALALAARDAARARGLRACLLTTSLEGEARAVGRVLAQRFAAACARAPRTGRVWIAAGETTVRVRGRGCGGRNQELALAASLPLATSPVPALCMAWASDGRDGACDAAGGWTDEHTLQRLGEHGLSLQRTLRHNDSNGTLARLGQTLAGGATGTNAADLVLFLA